MPTKRKPKVGSQNSEPSENRAITHGAENGTPCEFLTVEETAAFTKTSDKTIRRMIDDGTLDSYRFNDSIRVNLADICALKSTKCKRPKGQGEESK